MVTSDDEGLMLNGRQQAIMNLIRERGFASVEELAEQFDVTAQTIRRDINDLSGAGLLRRYHGGAGLPSSVENVAYQTRQVLNPEAKQRIGAAIAQRIPDEASLYITLGTTAEAVAAALRDHRGLRVITNNLNVAMLLADSAENQVIVAGGVVRHRDRGITGEATIDFMNQFKVDYAVMGISGIDADGTLLDFDYREVRVLQGLLGNARSVLLGADQSKFGRRALVRVAHLNQISQVYTDAPPSPQLQQLMADQGVELIVTTE